MMTVEEKDRFVEILFYLYFDNTSEKDLAKADFWNTVANLCKLKDIDNLFISRAVRILMADENRPQEKEMYYLLNAVGLTVRPIHKISGIYWQKQIAFSKEFSEDKKPEIHRRITDIVMKRSMRDFILAIYSFNGIFNSISSKTIEDII